LTIDICNRQRVLPLERRRMRAAVRAVLSDAGLRGGEVSIAVVDDATMAKLHQQFLDEPGPTDVLSFLLDRSEESIEGEVVVSAETARANATRYRSAPADELMRYVIHGTLHLVGQGDRTPSERAAMRRLERRYLIPR
jgi:probable rRNA maturation factor